MLEIPHFLTHPSPQSKMDPQLDRQPASWVSHFQWICRNAIVSHSYCKISLEQVWDMMGWIKTFEVPDSGGYSCLFMTYHHDKSQPFQCSCAR